MKRTIIGTGLIGTGLAQAALEREDIVTVYNRTRSKAVALKADGAHVADSYEDALKGAESIHLALTADDAVDAVLEAIVPHIPHDAIVIDHSTTLPRRTRHRAELMASKGVAFLHAPVFMSPEACRNATGVMVVAGPEGVFHRANDALIRMTGRVWYVGEAPDAAATLKLCGNAMIVAMTAALADGHAIARNNGLSADHVTELFQHFNPANTLKGRGRRMAEQDYETQWSVRMARKDVGLMLEASGERTLQILPAIAHCLEAHIADGDGERDLAIIGQPGTVA